MDFLENLHWLLINFWFPFFRDQSASRLDSRLVGPRVLPFVRRRGRLSSRRFSGDVLRVYEELTKIGHVDFSSTFPLLRGLSARRLDSHLRGPRFSLLVRRRGRLNPRSFRGDFLRVCGGLQDFTLVDVPVVCLVLPCPKCPWAALAFPRTSGSRS